MYLQIDWEQYPHSGFVDEFCGVEECHAYVEGKTDILFGYFHEVEAIASLESGCKKGECLITHTLWLTMPPELWEVFSEGMLHRGWKIRENHSDGNGHYVEFIYENRVKDRSLYDALIDESKNPY